MNMKHPFSLLLLVAGCQAVGSSVPEDRTTDPSAEIAVASQLVYDVGSLKPGQWVRYTVKIAGASGTWSVKYACVEEDPEGVWVENKLPALPRPMVVKSKLSRDGKLVEQWVGEAGSASPAKTWPLRSAPTKSAGGPAPTESLHEQAESLTLAERTYACTKVISVLTYPDKRSSAVENWYSPDVPFTFKSGTRTYGGVARRRFGRFTMELSAAGTDATPELQVPPQ